MTVRELIRKLQKQAPNATVWSIVPDSGGYDTCIGQPTTVKKISRGVWVSSDISNKDIEETMEYCRL